jgi:hypothetical protein
MKKPTLAQDRIGAHLWSFNFASKLIHGGTSTTMEAHQKHTASTASRPRCAASQPWPVPKCCLLNPRIRKMFA